MGGSNEVSELEKKLDDVMATLLRETRGSRSTLRIDDAARKWNVDYVCAEAVQPDVKSLRRDGSIDQRAAATVKWMVQNKSNLLQGDLSNNPNPAPPAALLAVYSAKAQMLGPLFAQDGELRGWISVHYVDGPRVFSGADANALDRARAEVARLAGIRV